WQAATPQMFRYGLLRSALAEGIAAGRVITDEASALEQLGYQPLLVRGRPDNIK
ncbi:MAG TPA: 2-C-methyl-D-erythritol 4-phosphate cytidylyltransferase, partial [Porticoccaceae bacterium]|nr:2-C-methyl-D-erythritol 4-phosphate cytidylyltransferase [Porticoccaceae bacterium]